MLRSACALLLLLAAVRAAASDLPAGLPDVTLGMPKKALLAARPEIKRKLYDGKPVDFTLQDLTLHENLPPGAWPYTLASYYVNGGRLSGVRLYGSLWPSQLRAGRLVATSGARALWGADYFSGIEVTTELAPVLEWSHKGRDARLRLPPPGTSKHPSAARIELDVRSASESRSREPDPHIPAATRASLFEECGVEDRRRPGPRELGYDELRAAPASVLIDGRTVVLHARLERDYRNLRAGEDGRPLTGEFTLRTTDGQPFPAGVRFDGAWVWRGYELWRIPTLRASFAGRAPVAASELRASASGGPLWPAMNADAVVRVIDREGKVLLVGAREQSIGAVGFGR